MSRQQQRGRFVLTEARIAVLGVLLALAAVLPNAAPARAADVFVQVNPSTVEAGQRVGIRASCRDNTMPATVESPAFGTVTVHPQDGFLTGQALVARGTQAGTYQVHLSCPDGRNASSKLNVVAADHPKRGPQTGFGGAAGPDPGQLLLAGGIGTVALGAVLAVVAFRGRRDRRAAGRADA